LLKKTNKVKQQQLTENMFFVWVMLIAFIACVFFTVSYKITYDDDFFWHLSTGRFIAENKYVPDKDIFGFVTSGTEWIPFEWGWDITAYTLYNLGGYNAILIFRSLLFCILFLLYFHVLKRLKVNSAVSLIVMFALLFAMMDRFSARPHVVSYFFMALLLYLYLPFKYINRDKNIKKLYFFPLIFLIWGNMHMGVLAGGLLLFVLVVSELIIFYFPTKFSSDVIKPLSKEHLMKLILISAICLFMLFFNPHSYQTYIYTYGHLKMNMMKSIAEWQNPFTGNIEINFIVTLYKIFVFSGIIIIIYAIFKKDIAPALVCIVFIIHSARAIRFTNDYEITVVPLLAVSLGYFINKISSKYIISRRIFFGNEVKILLIFLFSITLYYAQNSKIYEYLKYYRISGWGINEDYEPVNVFNFIKENNITGRPFNHFDIGGYLTWVMQGEKNFIDSRNLNDEIYDEYNSIYFKYPGYEKKLDKYGVDYVIFYEPELTQNPGILTKNIVSYLSRNPDWKLVYWDDKSMLFLKNILKFSEIINNNEYKVLNPYIALFQAKEFEEILKSSPEQTKIEMSRKNNSEPNGYFNRRMQITASKYIR
jgi:hypothetical protein